MKRTGAIAGLGLVAATSLNAPVASAHDYPVSSTPTNKQTVTAQPGQVSVTFDDFVLQKPVPPELVIMGPDGRHYETGCASVTDRTVSSPAALGPDGKYTVTWRIVSADGHPVSDSISFDFKAKSGLKRATGRPSSPLCASSARQESPSSATSSTASRGPLLVTGVALVAALAAIVALVIRSRRNPRPEEQDEED